jgi:hypothetical protein
VRFDWLMVATPGPVQVATSIPSPSAVSEYGNDGCVSSQGSFVVWWSTALAMVDGSRRCAHGLPRHVHALAIDASF